MQPDRRWTKLQLEKLSASLLSSPKAAALFICGQVACPACLYAKACDVDPSHVWPPKMQSMARQVTGPAQQTHSMSRALLLHDNAGRHALSRATHCGTLQRNQQGSAEVVSHLVSKVSPPCSCREPFETSVYTCVGVGGGFWHACLRSSRAKQVLGREANGRPDSDLTLRVACISDFRRVLHQLPSSASLLG